MATGFTDEKGYRKVAVNFPPEIFRKINKRASDQGCAFSTMVVELVKCGLYDYEDSEAHEPAEKRHVRP